MKLTQMDFHFWGPVPQVMGWLDTAIQDGATVLDVGPGHAPFKRATTSVDFVDVPGVPNLVKCDLTNDRLPFADKSFDFVYCRHLLEDSWNPFPICAEMSRVGKAGYIETPSPIAELARGVDGSSPNYRGYHHHRFLVWCNAGELCFVSKYPLIEHLAMEDQVLIGLLREGPRYWNTYYAWTDGIDVKHLQSPLDFDVGRQYSSVLQDAVRASLDATNKFWKNLKTGTPHAA